MSSHNIETIHRMSPLQLGMVFHSHSETGSDTPYVVQSVEQVDGLTDVDVFENAWQYLIQRHQILRTVFVWEKVAQPVQVVLKQMNVQPRRLDWRIFSSEEQERLLDRFLLDDRRTPFNLSAGPLIRLVVVRASNNKTLLITTFHHAILDGWSLELLKAELMEIYSALKNGAEPTLEPAVPYSSYIEWLGRRPHEEALAFWSEEMAGFSQATDVRVAEDIDDTGFGEVQLALTAAEAAELNSFVRQHQLTVSTLAHGIWALLLSHYSGETDVLHGSVSTNRPAEIVGAETMVGLFLNTTAIRTRVDYDDNVVSWLRGLQDHQVEAREHDHIPLSDIHRRSNVPLNSSLFSTILVFENYPEIASGSADADGLIFTPLRNIEREGYPLSVAAFMTDTFYAAFSFDKSKFAPSTIEQLKCHYRTLLLSVIRRPLARLREVDILPEAESKQIQAWATGTTIDVDSRPLHELIEEQAAKTPESVAVNCGDQTVSYRELNERANQLAHYLASHYRIGSAITIGVYFGQDINAIVSYLAVLKTGSSYLPLDPQYPVDRLAYMVSDTGIDVIVSGDPPAHSYDVSMVCVNELRDELRRQPSENLAIPVGSNELAYIVYTSGTSGTPKGILTSHRNVVDRLAGLASQYEITQRDRVLQHSSLSFDTADQLFLTLMHGGCTVMRPDGDWTPGMLIDVLQRQQVTIAEFTPSLLNELLHEDAQFGVGLRLLVSGGEPLKSTTLDAWFQKHQAPVVNAYGPTETTLYATTALIDGPSHTTNTPIGSPLANTEVVVVNESGTPTPIGVPGELYIGGTSVTTGYLNQTDLTKTKFVSDPTGKTGSCFYRTGDLVRWNQNGQLEFLARLDNQVKLRGQRIELEDIEAALNAHPSVSASAATIHEVSGQQRLAIYLTVAASQIPAPAAALRAHLANLLPRHMIPTYIETIESLPLTPNGKIDRAALPAPDLVQVGNDNVPKTTLQRDLAEIWASVFDAEVDLHSDFFSLGGYSLLAMRLAARLQGAGFDITVGQLMEGMSIIEAATLIEGRFNTPDQLGVSLTPRPAHDAQRIFCIHPGGGQVYPYAKLARELGEQFDLHGVRALGVYAGERPDDDVSIMAKRYWDAIKEIQPDGPYWLLGWSTGGVIAHEMCHQEKTEVEQVFLLEPVIADPLVKKELTTVSAAHRRAFELWESGQSASAQTRHQCESELTAMADDLIIPADMLRLSHWLPLELLAAHNAALAGFIGKPAEADLLLMVSRQLRERPEESRMSDRTYSGYTQYWRDLYSGNVTVLEVGGEHMDLVDRDESVVALAKAIQNAVSNTG